jgi:hypothetical protein
VDAQVQQRKSNDASITANTSQALMAFWDPQARMFGRGGGSAALGQVSGPQSFSPFLDAAQDVGRSNQQTGADLFKFKKGLEWDKQAFQKNMDFSQWATQFNAQQSAANAAAQSKSNTTGAMIGAGASILAAFI